jgi:hypothetical protein
MKLTSIICIVVFLLCLAGLPVLSYLGGRVGMPLIFPAVLLLPAEIAPLGVGFLAGVILLGTAVRSVIVRRQRRWTFGGLAVVSVAAGIFRLAVPHPPGFLAGLRDRFATKVGYATMREFAKEVLLTDREVISKQYSSSETPQEELRQWEELALRYPFLRWNFEMGTVVSRDGVVELHWGSPLAGHWGFQVVPGGTVNDLDPEDGRALRVSEDIQFVRYYD